MYTSEPDDRLMKDDRFGILGGERLMRVDPAEVEAS